MALLIGHFRIPKNLTFKKGYVQNISCETEFGLHDNNSFHVKWLCSYPRFKTETCGNSEMAYYLHTLTYILTQLIEKDLFF